MSITKVSADKVTAIGDRVLVTDMDFGEQKNKKWINFTQ